MYYGTAKVIAKVSKTIQIWYWPTLSQPYRVQTRLPGKSYRLHSAHDTLADAEIEATRIATPLRERLCFPMTVGEASVEMSKVL